MITLYNIGELSRKLGISTHKIRYYEKAGLLKPSERTASGWRRFDSSVIDVLVKILTLRELGLSVADIKLIIKNANAIPCQEVKNHLAAQRDKMYEKLKLTQKLCETLDQLSSECSSCDQCFTNCPAILHHIENIDGKAGSRL